MIYTKHKNRGRERSFISDSCFFSKEQYPLKKTPLKNGQQVAPCSLFFSQAGLNKKRWKFHIKKRKDRQCKKEDEHNPPPGCYIIRDKNKTPANQ